MATTTPAPAEHEHGHPGIVLATLALASFMSVMDLFIVNVALPDIASDLHSSLSDVAWVLNAYALFFGALLVPAGRFSDKYGRKNVSCSAWLSSRSPALRAQSALTCGY